jgi:methionyl-tRNA formyltransferase
VNIAILTSDRRHPVVPRLERWVTQTRSAGHSAVLHFDPKEVTGGDVLFLVSCSHIVRAEDRSRFKATLVLHASDLPTGRGWSPHIWAIVNAASRITLCLMEAADPVDTGRVWLRSTFDLEGHELLDEINAKLFEAELTLMTRVVREFGSIAPQPQVGEPGPYMRKRTPADSRLDPDKSIAEQFDLLRVVDNDRYPAFFELRGHRYVITIRKADA